MKKLILGLSAVAAALLPLSQIKAATYKYRSLHEWWEKKGFSLPPARTDIELWRAAREQI